MPSRAIPDRLRGQDITRPHPNKDWPSASQLPAPVAGISVRSSGRFPLGRRQPGRLRPNGVGPCAAARGSVRPGWHPRPASTPATTGPAPRAYARHPQQRIALRAIDSSGRSGREFPYREIPGLPSSSSGNSARALALGRFPCEPPPPAGSCFSASRKSTLPQRLVDGGAREQGSRPGSRLSRPLPPGPALVAWGLRPLNANVSPFLGVLNGRPTLDGSGPGRPGTAAGREAERLAAGQAAWGRLWPLGSAERSAPAPAGASAGPVGRCLAFFSSNEPPPPIVPRQFAAESKRSFFVRWRVRNHPAASTGCPHTRSTARAPPTPVIARPRSASRLRFDLRSFERGAACKGVSVRESALVCLDKEWPYSGSRGG
jgi:hypothetical protein